MFEFLGKLVDLLSSILERRSGGKAKQVQKGGIAPPPAPPEFMKLPKLRAEDPTFFIRKK